jgi:hypothetical protein
MRCSKRQLDQSDGRCPFLISLLGLQVGTVTPPHPNSLDQGRFWRKADMDNLDFHVWAWFRGVSHSSCRRRVQYEFFQAPALSQRLHQVPSF